MKQRDQQKSMYSVMQWWLALASVSSGYGIDKSTAFCVFVVDDAFQFHIISGMAS